MSKQITRSDVVLVNLYDDKFHDNTKSAHVMQTVITIYEYSRGPFVQGSSDPFTTDRYAFVAVPLDWDEDKVKAAIDGGCVHRTISCIPQSAMSPNQLERYLSLDEAGKHDYLHNPEDGFIQRSLCIGNDGNELLFQGKYQTFGHNLFILDQIPDTDTRAQDVARLAVADEADPAESPFITKKQVAVEA